MVKMELWENVILTGYLLWGKVGTGKSYFAGCIANALMEQEVTVRMTNFSASTGCYGYCLERL
jgi:DNA replication protein DnaC